MVITFSYAVSIDTNEILNKIFLQKITFKAFKPWNDLKPSEQVTLANETDRFNCLNVK